MEPRPPTEEEVSRILMETPGGVRSSIVVMGGPEEGSDVVPCPCVVTETHQGYRVSVAWQLNEIEVARLAQGGTLWLTTWGGLPIHNLEVRDNP